MKDISVTEKEFLEAATAPITAAEPEKKKKKKSLEETLDEIWDKYVEKPELTLEDELHLDRAEYVPPEEGELRKRAETELGEGQEKEREDFLAGIGALRDSLGKSRSDAVAKAAEERAAADRKYAEEERRGTGDAVRRGMGRSSARYEESAARAAERENAANDSLSSLRAALADLGEKLSRLESESEAGMAELRRGQEAEIDSRTAELEKEEDKKAKEAARANAEAETEENNYNKGVAKRNAAAQKEYDEKMAVYESKDASNVDDPDYFGEVLPVVLEYYSAMDPKEAYEELSASEEMKKRLGKYYGIVKSVLRGKF